LKETLPNLLTIKRGVNLITIESPYTKYNALETALHLVMYELKKKDDRLDSLVLSMNKYYFYLLQAQRDKAARKAGRYSADLEEPLPTNEQEYMDYWRRMMECREY
jgi:hypothetical protein